MIAETKAAAFVREDPRGQGLVLEDTSLPMHLQSAYVIVLGSVHSAAQDTLVISGFFQLHSCHKVTLLY